MAITLTTAYLAELKKGENTPDDIFEFALDSGLVKYGYASQFSDVKPIIKSASSLQNKLDTKKAHATRGSLRIVIVGRDNFKNLIKNEPLRGRRVTRMSGFIADGFTYADYAPIFTGDISDWSRKGDELTITVSNIAEGQRKIPVPNATKTQNLDYTNAGAGMNPVDIMLDLLNNQLMLSGIPIKGDFEEWTDGVALAPDDWTAGGTGIAVARESTIVKSGAYSMKLTNQASNEGYLLSDTTSNPQYDLDELEEKEVTYGMWVYTSTASRVRLRLGDEVGTFAYTDSDYHTGGGDWEWLTVTRTLRAGITDIALRVQIETGTSIVAYADGGVLKYGDAAYAYDLAVDVARFIIERDNWLGGHLYSRVLTEPKDANKYLNELQQETNSFIVHDGEKTTLKVFAPPLPTEDVELLSDDDNILSKTLSVKSGYVDHFFNEIYYYFDYDESGSDTEEHYENLTIYSDLESIALWGLKTKIVKAKWIKSYSHAQPTNVTGVKIYYASYNNGAGDGTLTFTYDAGGKHTLKWTPNGETIGIAVTVSKSGKFQIKGADATRYIRVQVTYADLAGSSKTDTDISIEAIGGEGFSDYAAKKTLSHYRQPISIVSFTVDINHVAFNGVFIKPTDFKDIKTDEAFEFGESEWIDERMMLTSVRPEKDKVRIEAIESKMYRDYGFITPNGFPDYDSATAAQKKYGFICDSNEKLGAADEPARYIW